MPHLFKGSRRSRSRDLSRCDLPSHFRWPHRPFTFSPMEFATPGTAKQHVYHFYHEEPQQSNERNMRGWRSEVDGKIVEMVMPVRLFLDVFVPSQTAPPPSPATKPFEEVPVGQGEPDMYKPLCDGLESLVANFPEKKRPTFRNNAHEPIKFPFLLAEQEHHATKPDVVASLPGHSLEGKEDRWRSISVVFEAKGSSGDDPMRYVSTKNDETLVQLSKSARNILVSQSRLFAFGVGIYGSQARIFRFDHAGAVCTTPFNYGADNGTILHDFLWRLVHPVDPHCDIVGADPTVQLASSRQRSRLKDCLHAAGVPINSETSKACRWVTVRGATTQHVEKYLLYELVFISPRLFSRATTIWKALQVNKHSRYKFTERHVIIKDAWRQLARKPETEYYRQIYAHVRSQLLPPEVEESDTMDEEAFLQAWSAQWPGLALFTRGMDLGEEELRDHGRALGQRTCAGTQQVQGAHDWYERSHMRLVSDTIGTPISKFRETKEMAQALHDAIHGHKLAFEAGVIHRDISEGNVMIANGRGFLHDLDYGFNWKALLRELGYEDTIASWEEFVLTEKGIPRTDLDSSGFVPAPAPPARAHLVRKKKRTPRAIIDEKGRKEWFVEAILAERPSTTGGQDMEYLIKWEGDDDNTWEPNEHVKDCAALDRWLEMPTGERVKLSVSHVHGERRAPPATEAQLRLECKQRTGTFYFMAVEILRGNIVHQARHDLESFFWLLVWLVLRHTSHTHHDGPRLLKSLFDQATDDDCATYKKGWIMNSVRVHNNEPLNDLLEEFAELCDGNSHRREGRPAPKPLTYEAVLALFEKALKRQDWPKGDRAIPFILEDSEPSQHELRPRSSWQTSQINSEARHGEGPSNLGPQTSHKLLPPVDLRPRGQRGFSDGEMLVRGSASAALHTNAQNANNSRRTPRNASSGPRPDLLVEPWRRFVEPLRVPPRPAPKSPTPSSRRASSSHSVMLPLSSHNYSAVQSSSSESGDGHVDLTSKLASAASDEAGGSRHGRKRSQGDLYEADELEPLAGPSKRSRTQSHSKQLLPRCPSAGPFR